MERMKKVQDVLLKAMAKKITWWEAAEIIGVSARCGGGGNVWRRMATRAWRIGARESQARSEFRSPLRKKCCGSTGKNTFVRRWAPCTERRRSEIPVCCFLGSTRRRKKVRTQAGRWRSGSGSSRTPAGERPRRHDRRSQRQRPSGVAGVERKGYAPHGIR